MLVFIVVGADGQAVGGQRVVHGVGEVLDGVQQSPIEVEDGGAAGQYALLGLKGGIVGELAGGVDREARGDPGEVSTRTVRNERSLSGRD